MGKREKKQKSAKSEHEDEEQENPSKSSFLVISDDDDKEANEDLSLKIIKKAMLRACSTNTDTVLDEPNSGSGVIDLSYSSLEETDIDTYLTYIKKKKERKKKIKKIKTPEDPQVDAVNEEEKAAMSEAVEINNSVETNPVGISDNVVLRKLLRGPRYFDPPDSGWGACYNCGEEGHTAVNCTAVKRKKPCFVCGSLDHNAKQCTKGQDCFICKKGGHRAKNCPEKYKWGSQSSKICLKCGDSGHDMFSCKNDYSPDDLKEIQCYICKRFGHLCCVDYSKTVTSEVSCYRCGQSGHIGLACARLNGETTGTGSSSSCYRCGEGGHFARECTNSAKACARLNGETTGTGSSSSCYRCGEGGHFARECTNSAKVAKRNRELSTPTRRYPKEKRGYLEVRSVRCDLDKARKKKKTQYEDGGRFTMSSKSRQRGGWITDDPGDLHPGKAKANGWRSPTTPTSKSSRISNFTAGGHASSSRSSGDTHRLHFGNSASNGSGRFYQHGFSASRFGNSSSDGMRRNYYW